MGAVALLATTVAVDGVAAGPAGATTDRVRTVQVTPDRAPAVNKRFFGMHLSDPAHVFPEVPIGAVNFTTSGVYWPQIETSAGHFDFTTLDASLAQVRDHGARALLVLGVTPSFHSTDPTSAYVGATVPDMASWVTYVRAVVQKYGSSIDYQIWPEPNVSNNWAGTPEQLATLVVAAAKIVRRNAPDSLVVAPAMVMRIPYQRVFMKEFFAETVNGVPIRRYFDVASIDPYPVQTGTPETAMALTVKAQKILAADGVDLPVWVAEINYGVPVGGGGEALKYSERTQASYVARTFVLNAALGVGRVYWLGWFTFPTLGVDMVQPDLVTLRAAGRSFSLVHSWLLAQRPRGCEHQPARDLYSCEFVKDGRTSWSYWTTSGTARVRMPAGARHAQLATGERTRTRAGQRIRVGIVPVWVTH